MSGGALSLRARARFAYAVVAVLAVLGFGFAAFTFDRFVTTRGRFADRIDPAAIATERWLTALVDQETGVRGFALTGDLAFLQPYRNGRAQAQDQEMALRHNLGAEADLLARVTSVSRAVEGWRAQAATPLIDRTRQSGVGQVSEAGLDRSRSRFDTIRRRYRDLATAIAADRSDARRDLDRRIRLLGTIAAVAAIVAAAGLTATWLFLNRLVLAPLEALGDDARRVADGDLRHQVEPGGPPEIARLAGDVEAMRARILEELSTVEQARTMLESQAADLTRSNEELEQFAYVASHDLQEPLRKVTGFCQLLQRRYAGELDDRADEYIAFAVDGAKRMQVLINDLLAFSRVGRTTDTFVPVDLDRVAASVVETLERAVEETDATVAIGALPTVPGDPTLLEALLANLVANALKFRSERPPSVQVSARPLGSDEWELTCQDNGIGIEADYAEQVFVIFQRLHTRDAYDGTGIGLALCRKIVEFHGGRIWVDTATERGGTTIRWTLPATSTQASPALPLSAGALP